LLDAGSWPCRKRRVKTGPDGIFGSLLGGQGFGNTASDFSSAPGGALFGGLLNKLGSMAPAAAGGWVVPAFGSGGNQSGLHQKEMILPSHLSEFVQNVAANAQAPAAPTPSTCDLRA
jgi:hypothetical protein